MTSYTSVFGSETVPPSGQKLRLLNLSGLLITYWPDNYDGPDFIGDINSITPTAVGTVLRLPPANEQSNGKDLMVTNIGGFAFIVQDADGGELSQVAPGETKYLYIRSNSTSAGDWDVTAFGSTTSAADANELAGLGLTSVGGKLALGIPVTSTGSTVTVETTDRAKIFALTGGSATVNLPSVGLVGNNFFIGVRNSGSGSVTIKPFNVDQVDGSATMTLAPDESVMLYSSGTEWVSIGYGRSTQFQFTKLVKDISAGGTFVLTSAEASNKILQFTGSPATNVVIILPAVVAVYYVQNAYVGTAQITLKTTNGSGPTYTNADRVIVYCDGANVVGAVSTSVGTNISVIDGSATAPAINFTTASDTGLYRVNATTVGLAGGGVEAARFSGVQSSVSGKFGVGNASPVAKVDIVSPASLQVLRLSENSSGNDTTLDIGVDGSFITLNQSVKAVTGVQKPIVVQFGGTERLRVNPTGELFSQARFNLKSAGSVFTLALEDTGANGAGIKFLGDGAVTPGKTIRVKAGVMEFINNAYNQVLMNLNDAGDLFIAGNLSADMFTGALASASQVVNALGYNPLPDTAKAVDSDLLDGVNSTSYLRRDAAPATGLVNRLASNASSSAATVASLVLRETNFAGTGGVSTDAGAAPCLGFHWNTVNGAQIVMRAGGGLEMMNEAGTANTSLTVNNLTATGNITAAFSDMRLKKKMRSLMGARQMLKTLDTFYYMNSDTAKGYGLEDHGTQIGYSAQQVEEHFPELVAPAPFDTEELADGTRKSKTGKDFLTVRYERMSVVNTAAINEMGDELDDLKRLVAKLEAKLAKMGK